MPRKSKTPHLAEYWRKRDFRKTPEPRGEKRPQKGQRQSRRSGNGHRFVIQKHAAKRLHYDFRLELDGVLKSWAVPKGPSLDPADKRLAVQVEDHPADYGNFEGIIPEGEYGGGTVLLWDRGEWVPRGDEHKDLQRGRLKFELHGDKLHGGWSLIRLSGGEDDKKSNWLLIKEKDEYADSKRDITAKEPLSVASGKDLDEIAEGRERVWKSNRAIKPPPPNGRSRAKRRVLSTAKRTRTKRLSIDPSKLTKSKEAKMPRMLRPQLATLVKEVPQSDLWLHELKFDGFRILAFVDNGSVKLITRQAQDWTAKFQRIAKAVSTLPVKQAIFDGEIIVQNPDGTNDFQALQNVLDGTRHADLLYYCFDLPYCEGYDLTGCPLLDRKELLSQIIAAAPKQAAAVRYSDHIQGQGKDVFEKACSYAMEGIVSKRADSVYEQRRSRTWTKSKCVKRQEFVVGGYTDPSGSRAGFGAILVGFHDQGGQLVFCGKVGTGFSDATLRSLLARMKNLETATPPFANPPKGREARGVHWLKPELVAEVEFGSITNDKILRHPSFQGLRTDKKAKEVTLEIAQPVSPAISKNSASLPEAKSEDNAGPAEKPMKRKSSRAKRSKKTVGVRSPSKPRAKSASEETLRVAAKRASKAAQRASDGAVVAGVQLSNPDRILYPEQQVTKLQLAQYYETIADWILPHIVHRPLSLVRCPRGYTGECFYQKHVNETSRGVYGVTVREKNGVEQYIGVKDLSGLISLVQMGALEIHPWGAKEDDVDKPDRITFDLDPDPSLQWSDIIDTARLMRDRLESLGLQSFVKTTGGKGLHVVLPIQRRLEWDEVKAFTKAVADGIVRESPDRYLATASKAKRKGKIFIDYLRNGRGATSVAAYSTRARAGAPVSTPLNWDELSPKFGPAHFTIHNVRQRLASLKKDPWQSFFEIKQAISASARGRVGA